MKTKIFLERKSKIVVKTMISPDKANRVVLVTAIKNIESLGYMFSPEIISILADYSEKNIIKFYEKVSKAIKEIIGVRKFKPMYPNFPKQVMEMDEFELYFNAILHYLSNELQEYKVEKRPALKEKTKIKTINLGTDEEFFEIFKNIIGSKVAMSPKDKEDVVWFISQYGGLLSGYFPEKIENKENLAFLTGVLKQNDLVSDEFIKKYFKTATDVLRYVTALSGGDVSLAGNTKFKKFRRAERSFILNILNNCKNISEDMLKYKNKWIKLGEILHPFEYQYKYINAVSAFNNIRNQPKLIPTFNNEFEKAIKNNDLDKVIKILTSRPGEFGRKLDWVLRTFPKMLDREKIATAFESVTDKISTTILLQLITHFRNRKNIKYRCFIPKGQISKLMLINNNVPHINSFVTKHIVDWCEETLIKRFSKRESLGKVYIDKKLRNYTVPFAMRSANRALNTVARGSKIHVNGKKEAKTLRMFIWWKQSKNERVDIDLSAMAYSENWEYVQHISFTNLKDSMGIHSGDIVDAPKGASEFIDIDIEKAREINARYIIMNVISYTQQKFEDLPECFAGCMLRKNNMSGEIYDPRTVEYKFDLTGKNRYNIPLIFDLKKRNIIWCDMDLAKAPAINCVETNQTGIIAIGKALTTINKPDLDTLFDLHFQARGTQIVKDKKDADTIFSIDEGIKPTDIDIITSKYL